MGAGWVAAAAAAVAVVAALLVYRAGQEEPIPPSLVAATRDAEITLLEPAGPVTAVEGFRWQGMPAPVRYRVEVTGADDGRDAPTPLWERVTTETRLEADEALRALLAQRGSLRWRVVVVDEEGYVLERSAWVELTTTSP